MRLAFLFVSLRVVFALWSSPWSVQPVRAGSCLAAIGLGVVMAWGRWRARAADGWLSDIAVFLMPRYRVTWTVRNPPRPVLCRSKPRPAASASARALAP